MEETKTAAKKTITTIFIFPTVKENKCWGENAEDLTNNGFLNAYSKDDMSDVVYDYAVFALFKPKNVNRFAEFLEREYARGAVLDDYDYPGGFVVVVYSLIAGFEEDYALVKQGKYSKTSVAFKERFPKVVKIIINGLHRDELSLQARVFKRSTDLVKYWEDKLDITMGDDYEVWDRFNEEQEILTEEILKEYE